MAFTPYQVLFFVFAADGEVHNDPQLIKVQRVSAHECPTPALTSTVQLLQLGPGKIAKEGTERSEVPEQEGFCEIALLGTISMNS